MKKSLLSLMLFVASLSAWAGSVSTITSSENGMFWECANLVTAPALPATTLARNCYIHMFYKGVWLILLHQNDSPK